MGKGGHDGGVTALRAQVREELEALGNDCARQLNRLRARLGPAGKDALDALTSALGPAFDIQVPPMRYTLPAPVQTQVVGQGKLGCLTHAAQDHRACFDIGTCHSCKRTGWTWQPQTSPAWS